MEEYTKAALAEKANIVRIKTAVVVLNDVMRMFRQQMVQETPQQPKCSFNFLQPRHEDPRRVSLDVQHAQRRSSRSSRHGARRPSSVRYCAFYDSWPGGVSSWTKPIRTASRTLPEEALLAKPVRPPRERVVDESDGNVREDAHGGHHLGCAGIDLSFVWGARAGASTFPRARRRKFLFFGSQGKGRAWSTTSEGPRSPCLVCD